MNTRSAVIGPGNRSLGHHAVAIVGYEERGLWVQNSWGERWGRAGLALLPYDDWLRNGLDLWAVQLRVPITRSGSPHVHTPGLTQGPETNVLDRTIVRLDSYGRLRTTGSRPTSDGDLRLAIARHDAIALHIPCAAASDAAIVEDCRAFATAADLARIGALSFLWGADVVQRVQRMIAEQLARRGADAMTDALAFATPRLNASLQAFVRPDGVAIWDALKRRAIASLAASNGGLRQVGTRLADTFGAAAAAGGLHVAASGSGALVALPLVQWLTTEGTIMAGPLRGVPGLGLRVRSVTLWRPTCTVRQYTTFMSPAVDAKMIDRVGVYALTAEDEVRLAIPGPLQRSFLQLVSETFERVPQQPTAIYGSEEEPGTPLLGLASLPATRTATGLGMGFHQVRLSAEAREADVFVRYALRTMTARATTGKEPRGRLRFRAPGRRGLIR